MTSPTPPTPRRRRSGHRATHRVRMVPAEIGVAGRRLRYAVSDNDDATGPDGEGSPQVWAVNLHGYFAGGGMYWRESAHLADGLGWRVVNPCLPGFAGSDPLPSGAVEMSAVSDEVVRLLDHLEVEQAVVLGHSMGGAVAIELASADPRRVLGVVYRDGVATPAWRTRTSMLVTALGPINRDMAAATDLLAAIALDLPDLLVGRSLSSTLRRLAPDARQNLRALGRILPIASMLIELDLRGKVAEVAAAGVPLLPVWGCFDRVASARTAAEFAAITGEKVLWVPGGHSWMLPRPQGQVDVLRHLERGRRFVASALSRRTPMATPLGSTA